MVAGSSGGELFFDGLRQPVEEGIILGLLIPSTGGSKGVGATSPEQPLSCAQTIQRLSTSPK